MINSIDITIEPVRTLITNDDLEDEHDEWDDKYESTEEAYESL